MLESKWPRELMSDTIHCPPAPAIRHFTSPDPAVDYLIEIYDRNTQFLQTAFAEYVSNTADHMLRRR